MSLNSLSNINHSLIKRATLSMRTTSLNISLINMVNRKKQSRPAITTTQTMAAVTIHHLMEMVDRRITITHLQQIHQIMVVRALVDHQMVVRAVVEMTNHLTRLQRTTVVQVDQIVVTTLQTYQQLLMAKKI